MSKKGGILAKDGRRNGTPWYTAQFYLPFYPLKGMYLKSRPAYFKETKKLKRVLTSVTKK